MSAIYSFSFVDFLFFLFNEISLSLFPFVVDGPDSYNIVGKRVFPRIATGTYANYAVPILARAMAKGKTVVTREKRNENFSINHAKSIYQRALS